MTARNRLRVVKTNGSGKAWVKVSTPYEGSLVAFEDVFDMVQLLVACEVEKYENNGRTPPEAFEKWGKLLRGVLMKALEYGTDWDEVADEFDLKRRDGTKAPPPRIVWDDDLSDLPF